MLAPMAVDPVVRKVVAGREPSALRAPYALVASVDPKAGVPTPLSQLFAAETVWTLSLSGPPRSLTARLRASLARPVAKKNPASPLEYAVSRCSAMAPVLEFW